MSLDRHATILAMRPSVPRSRRSVVLVIGIVTSALAATLVLISSGSGREAMHSNTTAPTAAKPNEPATRASPNPNFWADTVQVDRVEGSTLTVHSVRHPALAPYIVEADTNTIFMAVGGSFAPTPGVDIGTRFYFTGIGQAAGIPPERVRALRLFFERN